MSFSKQKKKTLIYIDRYSTMLIIKDTTKAIRQVSLTTSLNGTHDDTTSGSFRIYVSYTPGIFIHSREYIR